MRKISLLLLLPSLMFATDNARFYKAATFNGIQNIDTTDEFTQFKINYGYGSTKRGYNANGTKTSLLDIHGDQNLLYLGSGVPKLPGVTSYFNLLTLLINQSQTNPTTSPTFGKVSFDGKFEINEVNINIRKNIGSGFFGEAHMPIRKVKIDDISFTDLSPSTGPFTKDTAEWIQVKNNLNTILNAYGLKNYETAFDKTDFGDLSLMAGWQYTDDDVETLSYYSISLRAGLQIPTGSRDNTSFVFSIPTGHNQHFGFPMQLDVVFGTSDWFEFGAHAKVSAFLSKTYNRRLKTNSNQSGFLKLAEGDTKVNRGAIWGGGGYIKLNEFLGGLSSFFGYSFTQRENNELTPINKTVFADETINSDSEHFSWNSHVLHLLVEYNFGYHIPDGLSPRIQFYYDFPVSGQRIFSTDMIGGGLGVDITWSF